MSVIQLSKSEESIDPVKRRDGDPGGDALRGNTRFHPEHEG